MELGDSPELELTYNESAPLRERGLDPAEWFVVRTLAAYWGVSKEVIKGAATRGKIPAVLYKKRYYFSKATALVAGRPRAVQRRNEDRPVSRGIELLAKIEESYLIALADTVTYEDWVSIVTVAVSQAKKGEWRARKWLADYLLGTPIHRVAAEVDLSSKRAYSDDQRASAVTALLEIVRARKEEEIIDVDASPVGDPDANGEDSS